MNLRKQILEQPEVLLWAALTVLCAVFVSPAMALVCGILLSLIRGREQAVFSGKRSSQILQLAVVFLGFGVNFHLIFEVGVQSVGLTFFSISLTFLVGYLLGRLFNVDSSLALLLSTGTAICGGSAIAAMAPSIKASEEHTATALAVVFLLNGVALFCFPPIGAYFGLSQDAFGLWAALAIHDTSSVVGAAAIFGAQALAVGTTVKLTRALWILPVSAVGARVARNQSKAKFPWFLLGFLLASLCASLLPETSLWPLLSSLGKHLLIAALFLVGCRFTRSSLKKAGVRPLLMAVTLWIIVSSISLTFIASGLIHL